MFHRAARRGSQEKMLGNFLTRGAQAKYPLREAFAKNSLESAVGSGG